jgi:hypothetical protein
MQSINSIQSYRSAAHIASNTVDHRPGTYSTDSTFALTGEPLAASPVECVVRPHVLTHIGRGKARVHFRSHGGRASFSPVPSPVI